MELFELQAKIADLEQQIAELPAGSVTKKTISGNVYFYHRWTENKKRREKYIPAEEVDSFRRQIECRKALEKELKALQKQFPPEFVNRIDNVVTFEPLSKETIAQIVRIEVSLLQQRMKAQGHQLSVSTEVNEQLVEKSFDKKNGARPVKRAVQTYLEDPLTDILLRKPNQKKITIKQIQQV